MVLGRGKELDEFCMCFNLLFGQQLCDDFGILVQLLSPTFKITEEFGWVVC